MGEQIFRVLPFKPIDRRKSCNWVPVRANSRKYLPGEHRAEPGAATGQDSGALAFPRPAAGPLTWLPPLHCSLLWQASRSLQHITWKLLLPGAWSIALTCRALLGKGSTEDPGRTKPGRSLFRVVKVVSTTEDSRNEPHTVRSHAGLLSMGRDNGCNTRRWVTDLHHA